MELTGIILPPNAPRYTDARRKLTDSKIYVFNRGPCAVFCRIVGSSDFKGQHFRCTGQNIGDDRAYLLQPQVNYLLINSVRRFPDNRLDYCYLELLSGGKDVQCQLIWAPDSVQRECITYDVVGDEKLVDWPVAVQVANSRISVSSSSCERTQSCRNRSFQYTVNAPQSKQA